MPRPATFVGAIAATLVATTAAADPLPTTPFTLRLGGYGELGATLFDHGADGSRAAGAQRDLRLELDATRFVAVLQARTPSGWELEAELEIEHGGTGAAREIDYDEFGEYETEVEHGGEVILEELYLEKTLAGRYQLKVGRFYVALGHLSSRFRPTDYLAATRSDIETTIIPGQWDELGVSFTAHLGRVRATAQVVSGLDSAGFSSAGWVSTGHQGAYETIRATDLAGVGRLDVTPLAGLEVGAAAYLGGSSRNRPKPDLVRDCPDGADDEVAACGYVNAVVAIGEVHAALARGPVRGSLLGLVGHLGNAALVTERNRRLSNTAGVARTPVADWAYGVGGELGVDLACPLGLAPRYAVEPFVRVERFDTMAATSAGLFANPRYQRTVGTVGVATTIDRAITVKVDLAHRRFGASELGPETALHAALGFVY
ncbi:MAG: hypothetical protein R3B06_07055 [Kofleriaceae bacterium]